MDAFLVDLRNQPGELARITEAIAAKGVNIELIAGATCGESGRLVLAGDDTPEVAEAVTTALAAAGVTFERREIVDARMPDTPGALAKIARRLADAGVNIEALVPTGMEGGRVSVALLTDQPARAKELLTHAEMTG